MLGLTHFNGTLTALGLASLLGFSQVSLAPAAQAQRTQDPDAIAMPERRKPAGSRPGRTCPAQQSLTALIPPDLLGLTASASPTLLFYLPAVSPSTAIEFVLRDQADRLVYETTFPGTGQAGILRLQLPPQIQGGSIELEQEYHWYLSVICDPRDRAHDAVVEGLLRRVERSAALDLPTPPGTELAQIERYREQDLWHDALKALADWKRSRPEDPALLSLWETLLQSAGLDGAIVRAPLLD